jgi:hypothetical protein
MQNAKFKNAPVNFAFCIWHCELHRSHGYTESPVARPAGFEPAAFGSGGHEAQR